MNPEKADELAPTHDSDARKFILAVDGSRCSDRMISTVCSRLRPHDEVTLFHIQNSKRANAKFMTRGLHQHCLELFHEDNHKRMRLKRPEYNADRVTFKSEERELRYIDRGVIEFLHKQQKNDGYVDYLCVAALGLAADEYENRDTTKLGSVADKVIEETNTTIVVVKPYLPLPEISHKFLVLVDDYRKTSLGRESVQVALDLACPDDSVDILFIYDRVHYSVEGDKFKQMMEREYGVLCHEITERRTVTDARFSVVEPEVNQSLLQTVNNYVLDNNITWVILGSHKLSKHMTHATEGGAPTLGSFASRVVRFSKANVVVVKEIKHMHKVVLPEPTEGDDA
eukprot:Rmarinus@m.19633